MSIIKIIINFFYLFNTQGITIGIGLAPHALATALTALGFPTLMANSEYVMVDPKGIFSNSF